MRLPDWWSWRESTRPRALELARVHVLVWILVAGGCEAAPSTVELWIEPPAVYRFGSAEALPLVLPESHEEQVDVLANALREAVAEAGGTGGISVYAPYTGSRLTEPEYLLLKRAACEAGVQEINLALTDPYDPEAPLRTYDPAAAAPSRPPLCSIADLVVLSADSGVQRRDFLPVPPE